MVCAIVAMMSRSWNVVRPRDVQVQDEVYKKITFAPDAYCIYLVNETTMPKCHRYIELLTDINRSAMHRYPYIPSSSHHHDGLLLYDPFNKTFKTNHSTSFNSEQEIKNALSSWCMISEGKSFIVKGAESMFCLLVMEVCLYTMILWILFGLIATLITVIALFKCTTLDNIGNICIQVAGLLSVMLMMEWWGYDVYFVDNKYMASHALSFHFGVSFQLLFISTCCFLFAVHLSALLSEKYHGNYAQLHTAIIQEQQIDPLECPANYKV
jgi:hypothetical protein